MPSAAVSTEKCQYLGEQQRGAEQQGREAGVVRHDPGRPRAEPAHREQPRAQHHVAIPCEIFGRVRPELPGPWYDFRVCAVEPGRTRAGAGFVADTGYGLADLARADLIIVPAVADVTQAPPPQPTDEPLRQVAQQCGLGTEANLRHHFTRLAGVAPTHYRRTFKSQPRAGWPRAAS
jgi:AraC-like DNA-binding protein